MAGATRVNRPPRPEPEKSADAPGNRRGGAKRSDGGTADAGSTGRSAGRRAGRKAGKKKAGKNRKAGKSTRRDAGLGRYLPRPDTTGPRVRVGILWFLLAVAGVVWGRWAVTALWALLAGAAAVQVTRAWGSTPKGGGTLRWSPTLAGLCAVAAVAAAGAGTSLAGVVLVAVPVALVGAHLLAGRGVAASAPALVGALLAAVPAVCVVLVVRSELWAGLYLVVAVSFYDAGYFVGGAESTSRLEGPVTGVIGLAAVGFAAAAVQVEPFDHATAAMVAGLLALACPLGQMLVSAALPQRDVVHGAVRRLDAYVVAAPLMLFAVWSVA